MLPQPQDESWFGLFPISLAATHGIDVSFFSSRYLDVSVPWVRSTPTIHSSGSDRYCYRTSFLIQKSSDRRLFASFPRLIAGYHVFRRLSMPRHPPYTLKSLTPSTDHRHAGRGMTDAPPPPRNKQPGTEQGQTGPRVTIAKKGARRHPPEARSTFPCFQTERPSSFRAGAAEVILLKP